MAQSLFTFAVALTSASFASASYVAGGPSMSYSQCLSYGVDFQDGGSYFQNNASTASFSAFQYFTGCQNDTSSNVLVDPEGNQAQCSNTNMQPDKQTQLITCANNPQDSLYSGNWSLIIVSNNGNADPIAYQRDFYLDVGPQTTTTVYPTISVPGSSTTVETRTTGTTTTVTSTVPKTTITMASSHAPHGHGHYGFAPPQHGWTEHPHPSFVKTTKTMHTYTATFTEYRISASVHEVPAQCTAPTAMPCEDKKAEIVPTVLGALDNVAKEVIDSVEDIVDDVLGGLKSREESSAAAMYKRAIIEGRQPTEEEKRGFVEERNLRMARRVIEKRHPDNKTVTSTALQAMTLTSAVASMTTMTDVVTTTDTTTITVSSGTATVYQSQGAPKTTTAPCPTHTLTVYKPFAFESTTVWSTMA